MDKELEFFILIIKLKPEKIFVFVFDPKFFIVFIPFHIIPFIDFFLFVPVFQVDFVVGLIGLAAIVRIQLNGRCTTVFTIQKQTIQIMTINSRHSLLLK